MKYTIIECHFAATYTLCRRARQGDYPEAWVPVKMRSRQVVRGRRVVTTHTPEAAIPGYIFVPCESASAFCEWARALFYFARPLRNKHGQECTVSLQELQLTQTVCLAQATAPPTEVAEALPSFMVGQPLTIADGVFKGQEAVFMKYRKGARARVRLVQATVSAYVELPLSLLSPA